VVNRDEDSSRWAGEEVAPDIWVIDTCWCKSVSVLRKGCVQFPTLIPHAMRIRLRGQQQFDRVRTQDGLTFSKSRTCEHGVPRIVDRKDLCAVSIDQDPAMVWLRGYAGEGDPISRR